MLIGSIQPSHFAFLFLLRQCFFIFTFSIWFASLRVWLGKNRLCGSAENFMWLVKHHQSQSLSCYHHTSEEKFFPQKARFNILRFIRRLRMRKEVLQKRNLSWVDKGRLATQWWLLKQFKDFKEVFVRDGPAFSIFSQPINVLGFSFSNKMFLQNSLVSWLTFYSGYLLFANFPYCTALCMSG